LQAFQEQLVESESVAATEDDIAWILRLRSARSKALGAGLFGDVAWDLLLELFAAHLAGRKVRLCDIDIGAPRSTVARWAAVLEERGLISCQLGHLGCEQLQLELTSFGAAKMDELFHSLRRQD
jgi:hypothetical protein